MHDSCYIKLCSPRKLAQAKKRKEKQSQNVVTQDESSFNSSTTITDESFSSPPPKRTRSAGKLHLLHPEHGHISNAIPFYEKIMKFGHVLQLSLTSLILVQIFLLLKCDIITVVGKNMCLIQFFQTKITYILQNVSLIEAKYLFFRHVQSFIFEEHEIRTLQSLLKEYRTVMGNYTHSA